MNAPEFHLPCSYYIFKHHPFSNYTYNLVIQSYSSHLVINTYVLQKSSCSSYSFSCQENYFGLGASVATAIYDRRYRCIHSHVMFMVYMLHVSCHTTHSRCNVIVIHKNVECCVKYMSIIGPQRPHFTYVEGLKIELELSASEASISVFWRDSRQPIIAKPQAVGRFFLTSQVQRVRVTVHA